MKKLTLFVLLIAIAMPAVAALSRADAASVNNLLDDYVAAWLAGNQEGVMRLLIPASVLVPGEKPPYVGREAIRNYWWPAGAPPFRLDRFENTRDEILGSDGIAIIRGTQVIEWTS